ncbi:hypothetical protein DID88_005734 [Monilinia fructigena]|uniref:Uncharacterized protein n=1 Tax=Monilinia fructigena TaxID=38457 RepID=A0A395J1V1_9HELO|nr:hypothetical protein DID88_005734 [Monilinia fructigena]
MLRRYGGGNVWGGAGVVRLLLMVLLLTVRVVRVDGRVMCSWLDIGERSVGVPASRYTTNGQSVNLHQRITNSSISSFLISNQRYIPKKHHDIPSLQLLRAKQSTKAFRSKWTRKTHASKHETNPHRKKCTINNAYSGSMRGRIGVYGIFQQPTGQEWILLS